MAAWRTGFTSVSRGTSPRAAPSPWTTPWTTSVRPDDVVAGNYPLDVQTPTPADDGYVYGVPDVYGARLCVALPEGPDNLWVVGKTAGYDPLAAASARVVPFGMALGEAVGVAAAGAAPSGYVGSSFRARRGACSGTAPTLERPGRVPACGQNAHTDRPGDAPPLCGVPDAAP